MPQVNGAATDVIEGARLALTSRSCALLVGAGSSIACGYPGWAAFLDVLASACASKLRPEYLDQLRTLDPLLRADEYLRHLGDEASDLFSRTFSPDSTSLIIPEWIQGLFDLEADLLVTTNYSEELERAARLHSMRPSGQFSIVRWTESSKTANLLRGARNESALLYLHGRWDDSPIIAVDGDGRRRSSVILGEASYKYAYEHPGDVRSLLATIARTHTILIVGASLHDADMLSPFRTLSAIAPDSEHPHYAILPRPSAPEAESQTRLLSERYGIRPLYYDAPAGSDAAIINERLAELLSLLRPAASLPLSSIPAGDAPPGQARGERPPVPRIIHPLQRAQEFEPRKQYGAALQRFVKREQGGVLALTGIGGCGKTALVRELLDRVLARNSRIELGGVFVWSFYENPSARMFLASLAEYVTGQPAESFLTEQIAYEAFRSHSVSAGRLLIVMDGLERVQISRRERERFHGALESTVLRRLLLWIAQQSVGVRAVITTRFPLPELESEKKNRRFVAYTIDSLSRPEARSLLRRRGIVGTDRHLDLLLDRFGTHALTVSHLGGLVANYLDSDARRYRELGVRALSSFSLGQTAMRLRKLLDTYREYLEQSEPQVHALLVRVAIFSRPVSGQTLKDVFLAQRNRNVDGPLRGMTQVELQHALDRLVNLRFLYTDRVGGEFFFSPHPVIREILLDQLSDARKGIAKTARDVLQARVDHLARKPGASPMGAETLDLLEELIFFCVDAGERGRAYEIYSVRMGAYGQLSLSLDGVDRGERVLNYILDGQEPFVRFAEGHGRMWLELELALYLRARGRLREAQTLFSAFSVQETWIHEPDTMCMAALNAAVTAFWLGDFGRAQVEANYALAAAEVTNSLEDQRDAWAYGTLAAIHAGKPTQLDPLVKWAGRRGMEPAYLFKGGLRGFLFIHLLFRLKFTSVALRLARMAGRSYSPTNKLKHHLRYELLNALGKAEAGQVDAALATADAIRPHVMRCGQEDIVLYAHLVQATVFWKADQEDEAIREIEEGRRLAKACEFNALDADLALLHAEIQIARGNRRQAEATVRATMESLASEERFWALHGASRLLGQLSPEWAARQQSQSIALRATHEQILDSAKAILGGFLQPAGR